MPDPAPTPAPFDPHSESEFLSDEQAACNKEETCFYNVQWERFMQGGPLYLPGKPGYEDSRVIPQAWIDATDQAHLNKLRQELNLPQNPPQPQEKLSGLQPRCSGYEKRPVVYPDNVYKSWNPTQSDQISNREFREII
jgi:hypothetical protein